MKEPIKKNNKDSPLDKSIPEIAAEAAALTIPSPKSQTRYKSSNLDSMSRKKRVLQLIAEGKSTYEIIETFKKEYGVKKSVAYAVYHSAMADLKEAYKESTEWAMSTILSKTQSIYKEARERNQLKVALNALEFEADLVGLREKRDDNTVGIAPPSIEIHFQNNDKEEF